MMVGAGRHTGGVLRGGTFPVSTCHPPRREQPVRHRPLGTLYYTPDLLYQAVTDAEACLVRNRGPLALEVEVTLFAANVAAIGIGLVFLAAIVAVAAGYLLHMRLLGSQVVRAQQERALTLGASHQTSSQASFASAPQPAMPVIDSASVKRLRTAEARPGRRTSGAAERTPAVAASSAR